MRRLLILVGFSLLLSCNSYAQETDSLQRNDAFQNISPNVSFNSFVDSVPGVIFVQRQAAVKSAEKKWVGAITAAGFAGSFILLNTVWYDQYQRTGFHTFNDAAEWQQVDKLGHAWTTYNLSRATASAWRWAGIPHARAVLAGSITSLGFVTIVEVLDGYSAKWGWSWADMGANVFGTALFAGQELQWKEQKVQFKFSSGLKSYPADLGPRAEELFGHTVAERLFKDYNAQTYWLSANLHSFFPQLQLPRWLNLSVGYGAEGMFGGFNNIGFDHDGNRTFYRPDIPRYRQWYLAPDVDLTKIRTRSATLRTVFSLFNSIKFPAPALEYSRGKLRARLLQF